MENLNFNSTKLKQLDEMELKNINGGGFFQDLGYAIGVGLAYLAKGASKVRG